MILKIIIALVLLYYLILLIWLNKSPKELPKAKPISRKGKSIIGKSKYKVEFIDFSKSTIKENLLEPMDVDFDVQYEEDEEIPDVDVEEILLEINEDIQSAQGLSFEEMVETVDVIQQSIVSEEHERKAVQTISKLQQTELFEIMIKQINDGEKKVAEMLSRYDIVEKTSANSATEEEWREFDLGEYM